MGMNTHLSLMKQFDTKKMIHLDEYGWIETVLYQEFLPNQEIQRLNFENLPNEIYEDDFKLDTFFLEENAYGQGSIQVDDMIKLLKRCTEMKNKPNQEKGWFLKDHSNLISKLEALLKSKAVEEFDTIEITYW